MLHVKLEDIMTDHPITVKDNVKVGGVAHLLLRYRINGILVVSQEDKNKLLGILTTTDLLRLLDKALARQTGKLELLEEFSEIPVSDVATKEVVSFQKDTSVFKAVAIMHMKNVHTIPVYSGDELVGVVGRHDVLNAAFTK